MNDQIIKTMIVEDEQEALDLLANLIEATGIATVIELQQIRLLPWI